MRALNAIDPDCSRPEWLRVVFALHALGMHGEAREWSERGAKFNGRDFETTWRNADEGGNYAGVVTTRTLFFIARDYGYTAPKKVARVRPVPRAASLPVEVHAMENDSTCKPGFIPDPPTPMLRYVHGTSADGHPYIARKMMQGAGNVQLAEWDDGELRAVFLLLSIADGSPVTLQAVSGNGDKLNLEGVQLRDSAWRADSRSTSMQADGARGVIVCEGFASAWATACATRHEYMVLAATSKVRLGAVVRAACAKWPGLPLLVLPDRDALAEGRKACRGGAKLVALPADIEPENVGFDPWDCWTWPLRGAALAGVANAEALNDTGGARMLREAIDAAHEPGNGTDAAQPAQPQEPETDPREQKMLDVFDKITMFEHRLPFGFDGMRQRIVWTGERPWNLGHLPDTWQDCDTTGLILFLEKQIGLSAGVETVEKAVEYYARQHAFHPLHDWLDALEWDGVCRVDTFFSAYMGAVDTPYNREVARVLLLSMVARVIGPGCKVDTMPILEGAQGVGKSMSLRALASDAYFTDCLPNPGDVKEAAEVLPGTWLVEVPELHAIRKVEAPALKSFLSRQVDTARVAYGRTKSDIARQCVFVGTTNERAGYLLDTTGNRRFLPVCVGRCRPDVIDLERGDLFAEAMHRFRQGEAWWTGDETLIGLTVAEQGARAAENPWMDRVARVVRFKKPGDVLTVAGLYSHITDSHYTRKNTPDAHDIADALRLLGCTVTKSHNASRFLVTAGVIAEATSFSEVTLGEAGAARV
ncbi:VapE domain-containing protein [Paraburkholderia sp. EG286A]|uniref:VapE domain-containing protein n=1 Tax=Paraburkholderia sp. EG286A TaxID=3237014 RepID=UPI0034D2378A